MDNYNNLTGFLNHLGALELEAFIKCLDAYKNNSFLEVIDEIGFNPRTAIIYISLSNGLNICSQLGQDVFYSVNWLGMETETDPTFDEYSAALEYMNSI